MINKLKACLYILLAKRYAVFTVDETKRKGNRFAYSTLMNANAPFLTAIVSFIRDTLRQQKDFSETILNEIDNEQRND